MPSPDVHVPFGPATPSRPPSLAVWITAGRTVSLTATATPAVGAVIACAVLGLPIDWGIAGLALLGALLLQLGVNLDNDVEDHHRQIDVPGTFGGSGVLQRGWLDPKTLRRVSHILYTVGLACGLPAFLRAPVPMLIVGVLAVIGGVGYSGKPFGLKYRALGDLAVLLLCGPALTLGMGVAASGQVVPALIPLGLAFGLLAVGILHTNNWQDVDIDRRARAKTVAGVIGPSASRVYLVALYLLATAAWVGAALALSLTWALAIPLVAWLPTARLLRRVLTARDPHTPTLALLRVEAAQLHLMWGVLFIVTLGMSLV